MDIGIENMDKRKPLARTRNELAVWFDRFPEASLCLDLAHVRQIDPTMTEAYLILRDFVDRIAEVHLSEINAASKHEPISFGATLALREQEVPNYYGTRPASTARPRLRSV